MPAMAVHKSICTLAVLQPAPLKSVSTHMRHSMPAMPARKGNLHHIAVLQLAPLMRHIIAPSTVQPVNVGSLRLAPIILLYIEGGLK